MLDNMEIHGLTLNQQYFATKIWNLPDAERVLDYVNSQKGTNLIDARVALDMIMAESLDISDVSCIDITDVVSKMLHK